MAGCFDKTRCNTDPVTGVLTIETPRGTCTFTPGDNVSITENEHGWIINVNGEPTFIPKIQPGDEVDFSETEECYLITINNVPHCVSKCRNYRDCNGDPLDFCERIVTCEHLEDAIDGLGPQTLVTRGTGNRENTQTLTANHRGTIPNTVWRETWMERNGDIVTINSWNPITNEWDKVAIEAPENLVILNNPVIYIRKDTGTANPPINTQADLTPANAFNSFTSMLNFIRRAYIVGSITVDARGIFDAGEVPGFTLSGYKNAASIVLRGDSSNVNGFVIRVGVNPNGPEVGVVAGAGVNMFIEDFAFQLVDGTDGPFNPNSLVQNTTGSTITVRGTIRLFGTYNVDRAGAPPFQLFNANGGTINFPYETLVIFDMDAGTKIYSAFTTERGGTMSIGAAEFRLNRVLQVGLAVFNAGISSTLRFSGGNGPLNDVPPTFTGTGSFDGERVVRHTRLALTDLINSQGFGGFGNLADWIEANVRLSGQALVDPKFHVDAYSYFGNKYGSEWASDPRFTGA